ncbi:DUF4905 domain-containing protein [Sediminitomix flava]|uniref:Uncharacterized protein DUF4905 n=1 Tax=Sediminitomix flava TaxID=379075 RepID=A0A315ZCA9_SEDFL|nr:DUF4905 domain-containing protein [Sediminitomix flava]PWJ42733.1 uncharacterized protein DUF4905 [Sediminitomix flava]
MRLQTLFSTEGNIWKIYFDQYSKTLLVETRFDGEKSSAFSALKPLDGNLLWQELQLDENLWTGVAAFNHGKLGIHIYDEEKSYPLPRDLVVMDVATGDFSWNKEHVQLLDFTTDTAIVQDLNEDNKHLFLDVQSGTELTNKTTIPSQKSDSPILNPIEYVQENEHFQTFEKFLEKKFNHVPFKSIEYLETEKNLILSYYIKSGKILQQFLLVLTREGNVLYHEIIGKSEKGVGLDTFMIYENVLLFTKDQNQLISIDLN